MAMKVELVESEEGAEPLAELVAMLSNIHDSLENGPSEVTMVRIARALEGIDASIGKLVR